MPYIAFDLDALKSVPDAARAAKLTEAELGYGLVRLWSHCWNAKTTVVSVIQLSGFFGVEAAPALAAFGFLELDPKGWRVRGAERYLRVREHQKQAGEARAKGKRSADGRLDSRLVDTPATNQPDTSPSPAVDQLLHRAPSTEHRMLEDADSVESAPVNVVELHSDVKKRPKHQKQTDPRHGPLVKALVAANPGYTFLAGRDAKAVTELLKLADPEEIVERWCRAVRHAGFPKVASIHELVGNWNHFKPPGDSSMVGRGEIMAHEVTF